ncbi:BRO-N domain-containing protein [Undibacterium oligocarboniphilum]|uniref:Uncharacterized protein n=1 Tax=Undibacterium oligocarboniphilum TaxID=666702 RepID=A0A850QEI2_9BURK|nr:hypothetical protein [Undibacterium oligocarboniphilum]MBC3869704.1 hypothetical protein [Undibacterium oligocarboniphilum]NVO77307.1 hypothetical protein [Undibacterium oligocarboniphilum]
MSALISFFVRLLFCAAVTWMAWRYFSALNPRAAPMSLLVSAWLWAHLFSPELISLIPAIRRRAERDVLESWNGCYYSFDGHHLRFYLEQEQIWIPEQDLQALLVPELGQQELRVIGASYAYLPHGQIWAVSEAGMMILLKNRTAHRRATHQMVRFRRWLESEALPNVRRLPRSATSVA